MKLPKIQKPQDIVILQPESVELKNGLRLFYFSDPKIDVVEIRIRFPGGCW